MLIVEEKYLVEISGVTGKYATYHHEYVVNPNQLAFLDELDSVGYINVKRKKKLVNGCLVVDYETKTTYEGTIDIDVSKDFSERGLRTFLSSSPKDY